MVVLALVMVLALAVAWAVQELVQEDANPIVDRAVLEVAMVLVLDDVLQVVRIPQEWVDNLTNETSYNTSMCYMSVSFVIQSE
jgi:hypothetical protein